ncbi:serine carboxypeptidase-like [Rutidosis leptorrhynchoides]|uniref:serine carboxypeptidase-like n=1 Tax=Rutidosis leptorrhynchoides TaxID=125765 RepID=UPI003A991D08
MSNLSVRKLLIVCLGLLLASLSPATVISLTESRLPSIQAKQLITDLNLFPKHSVNIAVDVAVSNRSKLIVEKPFKFPNFVGADNVSVEELGHHAGYYQIQHSHDAQMFYFFFESRNSAHDPVVIWLTGGPGCSSELALFYENGPFKIRDDLTLVWNEYGWDQASNLLYVDQPTGTGFSYSSTIKDIRHDEQGVSNDLYDFLQAFFAEHPELVDNDFYITGESYAGHYIPAFAARVHQGNKAKEGIHINLKGFAIGNGLTDPAIQYKAYTDYALDMGIIKESQYKLINLIVPVCEAAIKLCGTDGTVSCTAAYVACNSIFISITAIAGNINYYDIRKECIGSLCYDFSNMETFLNEKSVREALGVGDIKFVSCSTTVYLAMLVDWMRNSEVGIPGLLEDGIKMLIYAGEYDLICNWLGNWRWVHDMEWSGKEGFNTSSQVPFVVAGSDSGLLKTYGPLSFLKVYDAGHMVPMDQPRAALEMLKRWMNGSLSETARDPRSLVSSI